MESLALHLVTFFVCSILIWIAGTKLETYAVKIGQVTKMEAALAGALLLAVATSLPELITCVTAIKIGDSQMAVHNLLGGVIMQTCILAFADIMIRPGALTHFAPKSVLLLQGVGVILLLAVSLFLFVAWGFLPEDMVGTKVSNLSFLLLPALYLLILRAMRDYEKKPVWTIAANFEAPPTVSPSANGQETEPDELRPLVVRFAVASAVVMIAGWFLTVSAEAFADETGVSSSFIGLTAVAFATSLPEISTVFASIRNKNFEMAIANIFGSNCFDICLIAVIAVASISTAIANPFSATAAFSAVAGILVTAIYLWGLLERSNRTILGMGIDSALVLLCSFVSFWIVYKIG